MTNPRFDVVIRNGNVIDGSGQPASEADVAVQDGVIVAIGPVPGSGREEIDATGRIVTPGFVDIHNRDDGQDTRGQASSRRGHSGANTGHRKNRRPDGPRHPATGYKADINVIDYDHLTLHRPSVAYDLPAGGRRLVQHANGYDATLVSGAITCRHGEATRALRGKLLRGARPAP